MNITATISNLLTDWSKSLKKFPLFFLAVVVVCFYLSYIIEVTDAGKLKVISPLLTLALGWLATYIANESFTKNVKSNELLFIIAPVIALLLYFIIPNDLSNASEWKYGLTTIVTILSLHLIISLVPFVKNYNEQRFLTYNVKLLENFAESALLNLIFYGILCLAVFGITNLFEINISYKIYGHLFIWIAGIFHTTNFLANFPTLDDENLSNIKFTGRFFKVLLNYILIPSTFIYGLIIYAYTFKLALLHDIKPWLTEMCVWYFVLGILTYYFSKVYSYNQENKLVTFFKKYFPLFSILIILVMFLACYHKLSVNGITDENYFLALLSIAAAIGVVPFAINSNIDKRILPTAIIILSILSVLPTPFNMWNASIRNQKSRLENVLVENSILTDGTLSKFNGKHFYGYDTLSNALYFLDHRTGLDFLKDWDKNNIIKENSYAYDIMKTLNINPNDSANNANFPEVKSEYFTHLPMITFNQGQTLVPFLNRYSTLPDTFSGLKINDFGEMDLYLEGKKSETLVLKSKDLKKQIIIFETSDKKIYNLYFTNLTYKYDEEKFAIEDAVGVVVK